MIITKLIKEHQYKAIFLPPKDRVFSGKIDEVKMREKNYPEHIIESFTKHAEYGSTEYTTIDWEINEYFKTIKGHDLIDIKFSSDKGTLSVLVITEKSTKGGEK